MNTQTIIFVIVLVAALALWSIRGSRRKTLVATKIRSGAKIIDVRSPSEFSSGSYPGAKNIPLDRLETKLKTLGPKDSPLVIYCASGSRSAQALAILKAAGFTDITNAGSLSSMPPSP